MVSKNFPSSCFVDLTGLSKDEVITKLSSLNLLVTEKLLEDLDEAIPLSMEGV